MRSQGRRSRSGREDVLSGGLVERRKIVVKMFG